MGRARARLAERLGIAPDLGVPATGAITAFIPLMVFAFLFGLSMDYEVFILSRIREEYDAGATTDEAVVNGLARTGRLVTSAALIFLAFAALGSGPEVIIKIFATGLAAGIILDAVVVRTLLVPAVVSMLGRYNWWLPRLPRSCCASTARRSTPNPPRPSKRRRQPAAAKLCGSGAGWASTSAVSPARSARSRRAPAECARRALRNPSPSRCSSRALGPYTPLLPGEAVCPGRHSSSRAERAAGVGRPRGVDSQQRGCHHTLAEPSPN